MTARRSPGRPIDPRPRRTTPARPKRSAGDVAANLYAAAVNETSRRSTRAHPPRIEAAAETWRVGYAIIAAVVAFVLLVLMTVIVLADDAAPISPRDVYVIDGDTIRVRGETFRLAGFDAPEIGSTARCESEVEKGYEAKAALVDLVHSGKPLTLQRIACSCPPSSLEGSQFCNYGRRCGTLRAGGEDVGKTLIRAGLAKEYPYRWDRVPPKPEWCGPAGAR